MKKNYIKPSVEIELYELSDSIASNCNVTVTMGPEALDAVKVCEDYYDKSGESKDGVVFSARSIQHNIDFWTEATCDCYYSASGAFFTS